MKMGFKAKILLKKNFSKILKKKITNNLQKLTYTKNN